MSRKYLDVVDTLMCKVLGKVVRQSWVCFSNKHHWYNRDSGSLRPALPRLRTRIRLPSAADRGHWGGDRSLVFWVPYCWYVSQEQRSVQARLAWPPSWTSVFSSQFSSVRYVIKPVNQSSTSCYSADVQISIRAKMSIIYKYYLFHSE